MSHLVSIRELKGWGLDDYPYRPEMQASEYSSLAADAVAARAPFETTNAQLQEVSQSVSAALARYAERSDLIAEMSGLSWRLGIVDLRQLLAFQRRLTFDPAVPQTHVPSANDWTALLELSFGTPKDVLYQSLRDPATKSLVIHSTNPNLHFRFTQDPTHPLVVHGGGPFFEVARFRHRWFLRDGYHRAYALLQAGIYAVPSVIVEATTIEELGADQPWFFHESVLFSETPPRVTDFLDDGLVLRYDRQPFIKTLRITLEETLAPDISNGEKL